MSYFKTAKGTELPILDLKGKPYIQVPYRVLWLREEHPDWCLETKVIDLTPDFALFQATVRNEKGAVIATGYGSQTPTEFKKYIEKAETKAIGRALGFCGYGTQFAPELDEEDDLADAPVIPVAKKKPAPLKPVNVNAQVQALFEEMKKNKWSPEELRQFIKIKFNKSSTSDMTDHELTTTMEIMKMQAGSTALKLLEMTRQSSELFNKEGA